MSTKSRDSPEVRDRAVRRVFEHPGEYESPWAAIESITGQMGGPAEILRKWVWQAERDPEKRAGRSSPERERLKARERENRELKRAHEILRQASAYLAQAELEHRPQ